MVLIGLDVGTTKLAALALDADTGETVSVVSTPNAARRDAIVASLVRAELDVAQLQSLALGLVQRLLEALPANAAVIGIGVTGQQHGVAFLDREGLPTRAAITWQDQRALEPLGSMTYLETLLIQAGGNQRFEHMGCTPAAGYLGASLYWLARQGGLHSDAGICLIPDAVVAALIGAIAPTDATLAGSTGLYDIHHRCWDRELLTSLGLETADLAAIRPTGTMAGGLTPQVARRLGLPVGTPVAVALGDNQASFLGSVNAPANSVLINIGTGGQVSALIDRFMRLPMIETRAFAGPGYLLVGAGSSGGSTLAYLHRLMVEIGISLFDTPQTDLYDRLIAVATAQPSGAEGVRCIPHFDGTRTNPTATGAWLGLTRTNLSIGNLVRALIEGTADDLHAFWQRMLPAVGQRERLVGSGNGLVRNVVLQQALGHRFAMPLHVTTREETAALGAALTAGVAAGCFDTFSEAMASLGSA